MNTQPGVSAPGTGDSKVPTAPTPAIAATPLPGAVAAPTPNQTVVARLAEDPASRIGSGVRRLRGATSTNPSTAVVGSGGASAGQDIAAKFMNSLYSTGSPYVTVAGRKRLLGG